MRESSRSAQSSFFIRGNLRNLRLKPMPTTPPGLTRVDYPPKRMFGYMARLRRGGKVFLNEFFADKNHGGKRRAQRAAVARYKEVAATAPPRSSGAAHKGALTSRNSSGQVGVRVAITTGRPGSGGEYFAWEAFWTDPGGRRRTVGFSWNKFGDDVAHRLACIAREREETDRPKIYALYRRETGERIDDERVG